MSVKQKFLTRTGMKLSDDKAADFITPLAARFKFSPDLHDRGMEKDILLFVADDYKEGLFGHEFFRHEKYLGSGRTVSNSFRLDYWQQKVTIVKGGYNCTRAVQGDVYAVSAEKLFEYDMIRKNTDEDKRIQVYVYLQEQSLNNGYVPSLEAWMYVKQGHMTVTQSYSMMIREKFVTITPQKGVMTHIYDPL